MIPFPETHLEKEAERKSFNFSFIKIIIISTITIVWDHIVA